MRTKSRTNTPNINKYDISALLLVVFTAIVIAGVWLWFGNKNKQIESRVTNPKTVLNY